ncbi:MAG TPA: hypothetical protein DDX29_06790 [Clostridiales bacterium]|nr:hypothetical protein [Clostridiales bacterium]
METFNEFKNAFSYGKRNNLNFKFLSHMTDEQAADFIEGLMERTGMMLNDGNMDKIVEHIIEGQTKAYAGPAKFVFEEGPFEPFAKTLSQSKIGLVTSTGHFVDGDDPAPFGVPNMTQEEAVNRMGEFVREKPALSKIPKDTPINHLRVRHGGYDISGVLTDHGTAFPLEILNMLEKQGRIGELSQLVYSFVGACAQGAKKAIQRAMDPPV